MKRMVMFLGLAFVLAGCSNPLIELGYHVLPADPCLTDLKPLAVGTKLYLAQCWKREEIIRFYTTSQGSQLVPYKLVMPLKLALPDKTDPTKLVITGEPFFTKSHIEDRWRFLALEDSDWDKQSNVRQGDIKNDWPVGFVIDKRASGKRAWQGEWLGLTCAACHTAQIEYAGKGGTKWKLRVEGGPAMADIHRFLEDLRNSLVAIQEDGMKNNMQGGDNFKQYLKDYEAKFGAVKNQKELLASLRVAANDRIAWHERNEPPTPAGYGRLDAFGDIYNDILDLLDAEPDNRTQPNAPVSYPFLWDTAHHHRTQWNGVAPPIPIGRNVGQALGVFAKADFEVGWFEDVSTIKMDNQSMLQKLVSKLRSPAWPKIFLEPEQGKVNAGKQLFEKRCHQCHAEQKRNEPLKYISMALIPTKEIGTDLLMAENTNRRMAALRQNKNKMKIVNDLVGGFALETIASTRPFTILGEAIENCAFINFVPWKCTLGHFEAYKGRPLDGIWATAPYLHNGSVPNLYYLLKHPDYRPKEFCVGTREFDPVHVGFAMLDEAACKKEDLFWQDTRTEGNSNVGHYGHIYGGNHTEEEIWQLIEYMKTL